MRMEAPVTTFVVEGRLPWPDDNPVGMGQPDYLRARLLGGEGPRDCDIRRISPLGAAVSVESVARPGQPVAVELSSGQRCAATVDWARGGEAGLCFAEPLDVIALINRNLVAQPAERRALPRIELRHPAHIKWAENFENARTRNLSARGMQLEGEMLPPIGTYCAIYLEGLNLPPGEVVWRRDGLAGIELFEPLSWASIIPWIKAVSRGGRA